MNDAAPPCRLYLVTPPAFDPAPFAETLAETLDAGDVACVQLRLKGPDESAADDAAIVRAIEALLPVARAREVALILNDRPDLAAAHDCDGVHIGQDDAPYAAARQAVDDAHIVGVTCHNSRHLAMEAAERGADYVAFGAFFATATKAPKTRARPDLLAWWDEVSEVPSVAIGGITVANCAPLVAAGADFLAVAAGVWQYADGPGAAVRAFNDTCARG